MNRLERSCEPFVTVFVLVERNQTLIEKNGAQIAWRRTGGWLISSSVAKGLRMTTSDYIAEIDENKKIVALWVKPAHRQVPRIFDPLNDALAPDTRSTFSGASKAAIKEWVRDQTVASKN